MIIISSQRSAVSGTLADGYRPAPQYSLLLTRGERKWNRGAPITTKPPIFWNRAPALSLSLLTKQLRMQFFSSVFSLQANLPFSFLPNPYHFQRMLRRPPNSYLYKQWISMLMYTDHSRLGQFIIWHKDIKEQLSELWDVSVEIFLQLDQRLISYNQTNKQFKLLGRKLFSFRLMGVRIRPKYILQIELKYRRVAYAIAQRLARRNHCSQGKSG